MQERLPSGRSKIGERLAQRDILQAQSVRIFAIGETPLLDRLLSKIGETISPRVPPRADLGARGFAFAARRSKSGSRSEKFSRRRACEFSPSAIGPSCGNDCIFCLLLTFIIFNFHQRCFPILSRKSPIRILYKNDSKYNIISKDSQIPPASDKV